jgi:hypothetical protein
MGYRPMEIVEESPYRFVIPRHGQMRVPGAVFATRALIPDLAEDRSLQQVVNVAELPGIVVASYASPDHRHGRCGKPGIPRAQRPDDDKRRPGDRQGSVAEKPSPRPIAPKSAPPILRFLPKPVPTQGPLVAS